MGKLGLIGGLGPVATIHYYRELVKAEANEMLIIHADMERALEFVKRGDRTGLAGYFARLIERLARSGADLAAISAVTPHCCIRELEKISVLPLVNIVEVTAREILSRGYRRVALLGTRYTVQSRMFGMLEGIEVLVPDHVDAIHDAYMQTVAGSTEGRSILLQIAHELPVDAVVLAGTDLSLIFDESNTDFAHIDCTRVHIDEIIRRLRD